MARQTQIKTLYATNQLQLAHVLALSPNDVSSWLKTGDAPQKKKAGYSIREWSLYLKARGATPDKMTAAEADVRLKTIRGDREAIALERDRKQVVPVGDFDRWIAFWMKWFVGAMERAECELGPKVVGKKLYAVRIAVKAYFDKVREDTCRKLWGDDYVSEEGKHNIDGTVKGGTAATKKGQPQTNKKAGACQQDQRTR